MNTQMKEDLDRYIRSQVVKGRYASEADAILDIGAWVRERTSEEAKAAPLPFEDNRRCPPDVDVPKRSTPTPSAIPASGSPIRLWQIRNARYRAVGPWAIGLGVGCALAMTQLGWPHPWLGLVAGYLGATAVCAWALAAPGPTATSRHGDA